MSNSTKSSSRFALALPFIHAIIIASLLFLFTWPAATAEPRDLPIGVVGPAAIAEQIVDQLESANPEAFEITVYESVEDAEIAVESREIYGALVLGQQVEVLIASSANPAIAQLLTTMGDSILSGSLAKQGIVVPELTVTDLAPLPEADARGMVLGSASLPIVIGGISLGALVALRLRGFWTQLSAVGSASLLSGATLAWGLGDVLGVLTGDFIMNSLVLAATIGAFGTALVGAYRLAGIPGFGLVAATFFLLGNPLSGVSIPVEFYPSFWGQLGQMMPLGAGFDLLKSVNFFEAADTSRSWWVLGIWIMAGLILWVLRGSRSVGPVEAK